VSNRTSQILLTCALIALLGGHWAVLQSIAWTTMLADNLRESPLAVAVEKTFGGKHPCDLCKQISAGKKSEKKSQTAQGIKKWEYFHFKAHFLTPPSTARNCFDLCDPFLLSISFTPPLPPPRATYLG
jgi:hypothetical protein